MKSDYKIKLKSLDFWNFFLNIETFSKKFKFFPKPWYCSSKKLTDWNLPSENYCGMLRSLILMPIRSTFKIPVWNLKLCYIGKIGRQNIFFSKPPYHLKLSNLNYLNSWKIYDKTKLNFTSIHKYFFWIILLHLRL